MGRGWQLQYNSNYPSKSVAWSGHSTSWYFASPVGGKGKDNSDGLDKSDQVPEYVIDDKVLKVAAPIDTEKVVLAGKRSGIN